MMSYLILAITAFSAQALLFVPIVPLLLTTGALAAQGQLRIGLALAALALGVELGDFLWYALGRLRGWPVLNRVCRVASEPDTCVRRTENFFGRYGARALLLAKFIPGLSTVALPLAGVFGMQARRFVLYDVTGVLLWCGAYVTAGYVSAQHVASIRSWIRLPSGTQAVIVLAAFGVYVAWKYVRRRRIARQLHIDRMSVDELRRRLESGEEVAVVDLRHPVDFEGDPYTIRRALYIPAEELERRNFEIPRDRDIVLYCTCPNEITSAREALRLRARGIPGVRPLEGGWAAWRTCDLPVDFIGPLVLPRRRFLNVA